MEADGIFPRADSAAPPDDPSEVYDAPEEFLNYASFDHDSAAHAEVRKFIDAGYLHVCDDLPALRDYLKADPVISRFAVRVKEKHGRIKRRIILDLRQSAVSRCTRKTHRVVLPRGSDAVRDALLRLAARRERLAGGCPACDMEYCVFDFVDAFWNIPLRPSERRHFAGIAEGGFLVYLRPHRAAEMGRWHGRPSPRP